MKSVNGLKEVRKIEENTQEIKDFTWFNIFSTNFKVIFYSMENMLTHFLSNYLTTFLVHFNPHNITHLFSIISSHILQTIAAKIKQFNFRNQLWFVNHSDRMFWNMLVKCKVSRTQLLERLWLRLKLIVFFILSK